MLTRIRSTLIATSMALALAACGGGGSLGNGSTGGGNNNGGSGNTGTTPSATPAHMNLTSSSPTLAGASGTVTLVATVTDSNNVTVKNAAITLAATGGALSTASATTDSDGKATATLSANGAASGSSIQVTATTGSLSSSVTVRVAATPVYDIGILSGSTFTPGQISVGQTPLAAGGSSGLQVSIVDTANGNAPYTGSATVAFSSLCTTNNTAQITSPVTTTSGTASTTYVAKGCSGSDTITAATTVGGNQLSATGSITVQPASLGGLKFISASPNVIGIKGTGQGETATIVFQVLDASGNPVQGTTVNFALTSAEGGVTLNPTTATSDSNGKVQTTVQSGTVHTSVEVLATIANTSLRSLSRALTVSVGIPTQNAFSLSAETLNIEGENIDGVTTGITIRLSDRYNNDVPDGTIVNFEAECGHVDSQCLTADSACSVTFTSQSPRTGDLKDQGRGIDDHRCSILAYTRGEESFEDSISNGLYDDATAASPQPAEFFVARSEAFLDADEDDVFNPNTIERYKDFNNDGQYNNPVSTQFVGLLCNTSDLSCPGGRTLNIFDNIVIVLASSAAVITPSSATLSFPAGGSKTFTVNVEDTAGQPMPKGTTVTAATDYGTLSDPSTFTVPNTTGTGPEKTDFSFAIKGPGATLAGSGTITIKVTSPSGVLTIKQIPVTGTP